MSGQATNQYRADLRDMRFVLYEQFKLGEILGQGPFKDWGIDEVNAVLKETYRLATEVLGPLNTPADREGCRVENGQVRVPAGFKEAWKKVYESGLKSVSVDPEHGGQSAPESVHAMVEEILSGANTAFNMYPSLAYGAAELLSTCATAEQQKKYCERIFNGTWGGTMCLTEPQAGSDVGSARATAKKNADGTYSIRGTKIFISAGDSDMVENVIHLVLARIEGAAPGTKGLSLFIVPKKRINADGSSGESNDVNLGGIEHKMGINASATCVLNFGENDRCVGELMGGVEHQGMSQMFRMMNGARIAVGLQGIGIAATAYLNALQYARERKQGSHITRWKDATAPRVPILEHGDVRRMLLEMKAKVEGLRALAVKLTTHVDRARLFAGKDDEKHSYHQGQVELLTPLLKAYGSDQSFRICELAIQVYGGAGFIKDYPVEQYCRDSKIFSIYEGTNHIQAMDLVGRKLGQNGGGNMQAFLGDVSAWVEQHREHPVYGEAAQALSGAHESLVNAVMKLMELAQNQQIAKVPLVANRFLEMMSEVTIGWLLLDAAIVAENAKKALPAGHPDHAFYEGKKWSALFYARNVLPTVSTKSKLLLSLDTSPYDIPDEAFATL